MYVLIYLKTKKQNTQFFSENHLTKCNFELLIIQLERNLYWIICIGLLIFIFELFIIVFVFLFNGKYVAPVCNYALHSLELI